MSLTLLAITQILGTSLLKMEIVEGTKLQIRGKEIQVIANIAGSSKPSSEAQSSVKSTMKTTDDEPPSKKFKPMLTADETNSEINNPELSEAESSKESLGALSGEESPDSFGSPKGTPEDNQKSVSEEESVESVTKFSVVYGDISTRKHKVYDFDGVLEISGKKVVLTNTDGKVKS